MKVYLALYNDCNHESDARTLSIHKTLEGAQLVIKEHRQETIREHRQGCLKWGGNDIPLMMDCGYTYEEADKHLKERLEDYPHDWQWWGTTEMEIIA